MSCFEFAFSFSFAVPLHKWKSVFGTVTIRHRIAVIGWTDLVGYATPECFRDGKVGTLDASDVSFQSGANRNVTH